MRKYLKYGFILLIPILMGFSPFMSTKALMVLKSLQFIHTDSYSPFMSTAWIKEIENLPVPTAYWPMGEGAGTNIEDIAGGNDLTLSNAGAWRQAGDRLTGGNLIGDNGGFEDFTGTADNGVTDDFDGWTEDDSDDGYIDADTANESAGTYCVELNKGATASTDVTLTREMSGFVPGQLYHVYFKAMSDGTGTADVNILDAPGAGANPTTTDVAMTWFEFVFEATAANHSLVFASQTAGGSVFFDEVSVWHRCISAVGTLPLSHHMIETTPLISYYSYLITHYASIDGVPVQAGGALNFNGATAATWMFWVYLRNEGQEILGRLLDKGGLSIIYTSAINRIGCYLFDAGGVDTSSHTGNDAVTMNAWNFVAVTYDGSQALGSRKMFYIGDISGNLTMIDPANDDIGAALVDAGGPLVIGNILAGNRALNGYLSHIVIDNGKAYTINQITAWQRLTGGIIQGVAPRS